MLSVVDDGEVSLGEGRQFRCWFLGLDVVDFQFLGEGVLPSGFLAPAGEFGEPQFHLFTSLLLFESLLAVGLGLKDTASLAEGVEDESRGGLAEAQLSGCGRNRYGLPASAQHCLDQLHPLLDQGTVTS